MLAKKIISKFSPSFYSGLRQELLSNEEAISEIAEAIMIADWRWDKDRTGHEGKSKTKYSYRNQCGLWAIKTYVSNKYNKKNICSFLTKPKEESLGSGSGWPDHVANGRPDDQFNSRSVC
jgi:hypothetical protein